MHRAPIAIMPLLLRVEKGANRAMPWERILPILVEFGVGALLCAAGLWSGWRSGFLDLNLAADRRMVAWIVGGFAGLLLFYCAFTFWLPYAGDAP